VTLAKLKIGIDNSNSPISCFISSRLLIVAIDRDKSNGSANIGNFKGISKRT
jgi:hypothetical protein